MAESTSGSTTTKTPTPSSPTSSPSSPSSGGTSGSTASAPSAPPIGSIVLVRSTVNTLVPAIVTNDFAGQNTAGAVSLIVFNAQPFDNNPIRVVPSAQAETKDISAQDLSRELFNWWQPMGSDMAKRDLQKEIEDSRTKSAEQTKAGAT